MTRPLGRHPGEGIRAMMVRRSARRLGLLSYGVQPLGEGEPLRLLRQRKAIWLVTLPVAVASWLSAHCLAYVLVPPEGSGVMHDHMAGSHNWLASMPVLVAAGITVLAAGVVLCVGDGLRGGALRTPAPLLALLPPIGFVVQEHLEHMLASGTSPFEVALQPTFLTGLALELPFAVGTLLLAGALCVLAHRFGRLLARAIPATRPALPQPVAMVGLVRAVSVALPSVLVLAHAPRAPPPCGLRP
jgi:hypothetical protein